MWIQSKYGFFSIVRKGEPGTVQIRARVINDLRNLCVAIQIPLSRIIKTPGGDYAQRIIVNENELTEVMFQLQKTIDYSNFKSMIDRTPDQAKKHGAYSRAWSIFGEFQPGGPYSRGHDREYSRDDRDFTDVYTSRRSEPRRDEITSDWNTIDNLDLDGKPIKGFIGRQGDAIYFHDGKSVYKANHRNVVDVTTGYIIGRFEHTIEAWNRWATDMLRPKVSMKPIYVRKGITASTEIKDEGLPGYLLTLTCGHVTELRGTGRTGEGRPVVPFSIFCRECTEEAKRKAGTPTQMDLLTEKSTAEILGTPSVPDYTKYRTGPDGEMVERVRKLLGRGKVTMNDWVMINERLVQDLEREFRVKITRKDSATFQVVGDIVSWLEDRLVPEVVDDHGSTGFPPEPSSRAEIYDDLKSVFARLVDVETFNRMYSSTRVDELVKDEMAFNEMIEMIEEEFEIAITKRLAEKIKNTTVAVLVDTIDALVQLAEADKLITPAEENA